MSGSFIIGFSSVCITCIINSQYNKIKVYNNEILEQKEAINKISRICESLSISKILNYIDDYNISYKYIIISIIIIVIDIILLSLYINCNNNYIQLTLISVILALLIILIIILYFNYKYINKNEDEINNKGIEIINKKDEINNIYYKKLLIIVNDNGNDNEINYINSNIDEYISNHSYIYNIYVKNCIKIFNCNKYILIPIVNIRKDKNILLNDIRNDLIKNKKDDLMIIMNAKFKRFKEITPEIVKNELDEYDNTLDIYKKSLELKIKNINDLLHINDCIINII